MSDKNLEYRMDRVEKYLEAFTKELFYRNVNGLFHSLDLHFDWIRRKVKVGAEGEYDIVANNQGQVLVIEVKNKLSKRLVDEFLEKRLPRFKTLLPEYKGSKIWFLHTVDNKIDQKQI